MKLSIIIPIRNESNVITKTLDLIANKSCEQTLAKAIDLIANIYVGVNVNLAIGPALFVRIIFDSLTMFYCFKYLRI